MKKARMIVSAAVIFAVVGSALAFKPLGSGNIYCLAPGTVDGACPSSALIQYRIHQTQGVADPCPGTPIPHINSGSPVQCVNAPGPLYIQVED